MHEMHCRRMLLMSGIGVLADAARVVAGFMTGLCRAGGGFASGSGNGGDEGN
jgi:hypothetical protein